MICPSCHTENRPGDKFCEQCGTPLTGVEDGAAGPGATVTETAPEWSGVLIRTGPDGEETYALGARAIVGRLDTSDIPVDDKSVSREHARLSRMADSYVLEDLGSTNGTMVDGERIDEAVILRAGDRVTFGSVDFRFDVVPTNGQQTQAQPEQQQAKDAPPAESGSRRLGVVPWARRGSGGGALSSRLKPGNTPSSIPFVPPRAPEEGQNQPGPAVSGASTGQASPVSTGPSASGEDIMNEAVDTANRLTTLVQELVGRLRYSETQRTQLQERLGTLEALESAQESMRQALSETPTDGMPMDQVRAVEQMVESLRDNPNDIQVLMRVSQQAGGLAAVLEEYTRLRGTLEHISGSLGEPAGK